MLLLRQAGLLCFVGLRAKSGFHCGLQNLNGSYLALYIES